MKITQTILLIMTLLLIVMVVKPKDFDFIAMTMLFCTYCICKTIEEKKQHYDRIKTLRVQNTKAFS